MRFSGVLVTTSMMMGGCEDSAAGFPLAHSREMPITANILLASVSARVQVMYPSFALSSRDAVSLYWGWPACATVPASEAINTIDVVVMILSRFGCLQDAELSARQVRGCSVSSRVS